jgi:hypothetical protein
METKATCQLCNNENQGHGWNTLATVGNEAISGHYGTTMGTDITVTHNELGSHNHKTDF